MPMPTAAVSNEPSFKDSDAFKAAVADAAAVAVRDILAGEMAALKQASNAASGQSQAPNMAEMQGLLSALALNIANLSTQGSGQVKPVSPEVMAFREKSRQKMYDLLNEAHKAGAWPEYELSGQVYLNGQIVEPLFWDGISKKFIKTKVSFYGEPNDSMVPVNDTSKAIFAEFRNAVGDQASDVPVFQSPWVQNGQEVFMINNGLDRPEKVSPVDDASPMFRITSENGKREKAGKLILGTIFPHAPDSTLSAGA